MTSRFQLVKRDISTDGVTRERIDMIADGFAFGMGFFAACIVFILAVVLIAIGVSFIFYKAEKKANGKKSNIIAFDDVDTR